VLPSKKHIISSSEIFIPFLKKHAEETFLISFSKVLNSKDKMFFEIKNRIAKTQIYRLKNIFSFSIFFYSAYSFIQKEFPTL